MIKLNGVEIAERQLEADLEALARLRSLAEKCTASYNLEAGNGRSGDKLVDTTIRIIELEEKIKQDRNDVVCRTIETRNLLESISNADERLLMTLRYVNCKTWEEIADVMNYSPRQIYRIHNTVIENLKGVAVTE